MFWIIIQILDFIYNGRYTFLLVIFTLGILEFGLFAFYSNKYKPYINNFREPISIVISVFKEEPNLFKKCLDSIKEQVKKEDEIVIVFDGEDKNLQKIAERYGTIYVKEHGGKRSTLSYGCDRVKNNIIITIDSDTILCSDCVDKIIMPFVNKEIGAVSANQRIFNANMNLASKFADYNELMAFGFMQKATSAAGNVPVLYGRCLAIRKCVWDKISEKYKNKMFLGKKVESGDDNDITILTIQEGYKTFMQNTAKVTSDCPREFFKRLKQQYRFNRSSIRVTITDWCTNLKLINSAKLGFINQMTAIVFPFLVFGVWIEWYTHIINGYTTIIELSYHMIILTSIITLSSVILLRNLVLLERKEDLLVWILYSFYSWSIINIMHIFCVLTVIKPEEKLVQYSRNG